MPRILVGRRRRAAGLLLGVVLLHAVWLRGAWQSPQRPVGPALKLRLLPRAVVPAAEAPAAVAQAPSQARPVPARPPTRAGAEAQKASGEAGVQAGPSQAAASVRATAVPRPAAAEAPTAGEPDAIAPPVYPAALPSSLQARYRFMRNGAEGSAALRWRQDGQQYEAEMAGEAGGRAVFEWHSRGRIGANGAEPALHLDRRSGRAAQQAQFQRDGTARITYTRPGLERPLPEGAQDRLSLLLQVAGIVGASPARWGPGQELLVYVSGARDAQVWRFRVAGPEAALLADGSQVPALRLVREPDAPYALRVELWLDPQRQHLPVRMRFTNESSAWDLQWAADGPER